MAHAFDKIGDWATAIAQSNAASDNPTPEGATCSGRVCQAPGYGEVHEKFTYFDENGMRYGYLATQGLPSFIQHAENNWSVTAISDAQSKIEFRGEVDLKTFPGIFVAPIFQWQMSRIGNQVAEELKYYIENGEPHPRKQKQLAKLFANA